MIENEIMEYFRELNLASLIVRYVLAVICGGLIGLEREKRQRPAGFRTHILVCVGAATAFIIGQYLVERGFATDVSRLAAQVISGIGFLGAGTIIVTQHQRIKGLTTAAGLWAAACMGLAIGAGFYEAAVVGTALILIIASIMKSINRQTQESSRHLTMYMEFESAASIGTFIDSMKQRGIELSSVEIDRTEEGKLSVAVVELKRPEQIRHSELVESIKLLEGVKRIEEL